MDKKEKEIIRFYRDVFGSEKGKLVLSHMLVELHYFDEIENQEEAILSNYAKRLLRHIGVLKGETVKAFVDRLMEINVLNLEDEHDDE